MLVGRWYTTYQLGIYHISILFIFILLNVTISKHLISYFFLE